MGFHREAVGHLRAVGVVASMLGFATAVLACAGAVVTGCGASSREAAADAAPPEASLDSSAADVSADAGPDAEQDPNIYPAKHHPIPQVDDNGGPVIANPVVVTVTFNYVVGTGHETTPPGVDAGQADAAAGDAGAGSDPLAPALEQFDDVILTTAWWAKSVGAYKVGPGKSGGHVRLPDSLGPGMGTVSNSVLDDPQVQQFLQQEVLAGALPAPTADSIYAFYFPPSTSNTLSGAVSCEQGGFGGYHSAAMVTDPLGNSTTAVYAVIDQCDLGNGPVTLDPTTITASHEFAEAVSDPLASTFYLVSNDAWGLLGAGSVRGRDRRSLQQRDRDAVPRLERLRSPADLVERSGGAEPGPGPAHRRSVPASHLLQRRRRHPDDRRDPAGVLADGYMVVKRGHGATPRLHRLQRREPDGRSDVQRRRPPQGQNPGALDAMPDFAVGSTLDSERPQRKRGNARRPGARERPDRRLSLPCFARCSARRTTGTGRSSSTSSEPGSRSHSAR